MRQINKHHTFKLSYHRVLVSCVAGYCYASWLSLVLAEWLPFEQAENVYFSVFISFIFYIVYVLLISTLISKWWFWGVNSLGMLLFMSYWL